MQYLEVYNETIRDLLVENSKALDLREDPDQGIFVAGLCERYPKTADEVLLYYVYLLLFSLVVKFAFNRYFNFWRMEMQIGASLQRKQMLHLLVPMQYYRHIPSSLSFFFSFPTNYDCRFSSAKKNALQMCAHRWRWANFLWLTLLAPNEPLWQR